MENKLGKLGSFEHLCALWYELFYGDNRGQIYHLFDQEKEALLNHLDGCAVCKVMLEQVDPMATNVNYMRQMNQQAFSQFIRILYKKAQRP